MEEIKVKKIKCWLLCLLALSLLLTACPGAETTVPKGKVTVSLSEDAINYFSSLDKVTVSMRNIDSSGNNDSEGVFNLTKEKPDAIFMVVPGKYNIVLTNSQNLPVSLSKSFIEVKAEDDLKVMIDLQDIGTLTINADTGILEESESINLTLHGNSDFNFEIEKSKMNDSINLPVGTYSVWVNSSSYWFDASTDVTEITIEKGKDTKLPVSFNAYGDLSVSCNVKPEKPITLTVLQEAVTYKSIVIESQYQSEKLPVGDYSLSLSTDDKDVDISLDPKKVSISKGEYSDVKVSYQEMGTVQFDLSDKLISLLSASSDSITVTMVSSSNVHMYFSITKDELDNRSFTIPVGSYTVSVSGTVGGNDVFSIQNELEITKGSTGTISLDVEEIGYVSLKFNSVLNTFAEDEFLTVDFIKNYNSVKQIKVTKDFDGSKPIEIPTGTYNISITPSDESKYQVTYDQRQITVLDEPVEVGVVISKSGVCEISIDNPSGIKRGYPINLVFDNNEGLTINKSLTGSYAKESVTLPEGNYSVRASYNQTMYNVSINSESVEISYGKTTSLSMTVKTEGSIDVSIDIGFEPSFKFKVVKYTKYVPSENADITFLEVVGASPENQLPPKGVTVVWYDPDPSNSISENVGNPKEYEILNGRLDRIEVRIIVDGKIVAASKIDEKKIEER